MTEIIQRSTARGVSTATLPRRRSSAAGLGFALVAASVGIPTVSEAAPEPSAANINLPGSATGKVKTLSTKHPVSVKPLAPAASAIPVAKRTKTYTVKSGDTVSHIALRTDVSVKAIVEANNLNSDAFIVAGQKLNIPNPSKSSSTSSNSKSSSSSSSTTSSKKHTVKSGDTVSHIAAKHHISVQEIVKANDLGSNALIFVGQTLTIPGSGDSSDTLSSSSSSKDSKRSSPKKSSYSVKSGDTLSHIAVKHDTTVSKLVSANDLSSNAVIYVGQKLSIPANSQSSSARSSGDLVGNEFAGRTYPEATVDAANTNKAALLETSVPSKTEMQSIITQTASDMGVDPALALAVAHQESGFNHQSVSPANAIGAMQVIPSSGEWASDLVGRDLNLLDPQDNVVAGVAILRALVSTSPDLPTAIAGYYQGQGSVRDNGMFSDTRVYVANIQTLMNQY